MPAHRDVADAPHGHSSHMIAAALDEWREMDSGTARLIRAAVMSREPRRLRQAWQVLAARAELARALGYSLRL